MGGFADLTWDGSGLLPAIVQDVTSKQVLMLAWMNDKALRLTLQTGEVHFWSRSRQALWRKGETSGNVMVVSGVNYDCDGDALLVQVWPQGPACHTGEQSCFFRELTLDDAARTRGGQRSVRWALEWPEEAAEGAEG